MKYPIIKSLSSRILPFCFAAAAVIPPASELSAGTTQPLTITYPALDAQTGTITAVRGRSNAEGSAQRVQENPQEQKPASFHLNWDLTGSSERHNNFMRFDTRQRLLGQPLQIVATIYAEESAAGAPVNLWLYDSTGETFILRSKVPAAGRSELVFDVTSASPAWESGNKNRKIDLPATLQGFAIGEHGTRGEVWLEQVSVTASGTATQLLETSLMAEQSNALGWGEEPRLQLKINNRTDSTVEDLQTVVTVRNYDGDRIILEKNEPVATLNPQQETGITITPEIPYGVFKVSIQLQQNGTELSNTLHAITVGHMFADVSAISNAPQELAYVRKWSPIGGIFWRGTFDLERMKRTGAIWERFGNTTQWRTVEQEKGKLNLSHAISEVNRLYDAGFDLVFFNTVYNQPSFYRIDQQDFAPAYGRLHAAQARAFGDRVGTFELGNEDNGPTKFVYTEIARNGAAGVRSGSASALIANSGTAQIDIGWLRMQARRGLLDRMDALITHPYSWSSSPESYGVLEQLNLVNDIIDELGGMKVQLTTEFGYPHTANQDLRAQWTPRHFAIGAAVGLWRHGLYAFDNHFGIYDNGRPYPVAATVNAYAAFTYGRWFAGWFEKTDSVWVAVFETAGEPIAMAWSPKGKGSVELSTAPASGGLKVYDMYGNPLSVSGNKITLTGEPVYITGIDRSTLNTAYADTLRLAQERYSRLLKKSPLAKDKEWNSFAATSFTTNPAQQFRQLSAALERWNPAQTVQPSEQAVIAQTLRWISAAAHAQAVLNADSPARIDWSDKSYQSVQDTLSGFVAEDVDVLSLRWLLHEWSQIRDQAAYAGERGKQGYAAEILRVQKSYEHVASVLAQKGERIFFPLWPYLHASAPDGNLNERIEFTPGKPVPVKVRLLSYASKPYEVKVDLDLPGSWKVEPSQWEGIVTPGIEQQQTISFMVTASSERPQVITAKLNTKGKPEVKIPYSDFDLLPPLEVSVPVVSTPLPEAALPLQFVNNGNEPISAKVRILTAADLPALARLDVKDLQPGQSRQLEVTLPSDTAVPSFNQWALIADVRTNKNESFQEALTVDFDVAIHLDSPLSIDGNLKDWQHAMPLHLDKEAYTFGSFSGGWSPEDLSGTVYTAWDGDYLYFAVDVTDQLFQQALSESDVWNEDSVQIALADPNGRRTEISLALTPKGPQVWKYNTGLLDDARLNVSLLQGRTVYEAAIPWKDIFADFSPKEGTVLRFDILLNDHDAIINRRMMGRYGMGIVHSKDVNLLGYLRLGPAAAEQTPSQPESPEAKVVFFENFEEYAEGSRPDVWEARSHQSPVPTAIIRKGLGVDNSNALELHNSVGSRPFTYLALTRPMTAITADKKYRLSATVKGSNVPNTKGIIGVCSDNVGNESFRFIQPWTPSDEWQQVHMDFKAPGGVFNVLIRNSSSTMDGLLIDNIEVREIE